MQKSFASYHNLGIGGFDWSDDVIAVHELYTFKDYKGNDVLGVYVLSIAFMAIIQAYQSIEQSRNRFKGPLVAAGVGLLVKLLTTGFFTIRWGTLGASWSTILGLLATLFVLVRQSDAAINCFVRERSFLKNCCLV